MFIFMVLSKERRGYMPSNFFADKRLVVPQMVIREKGAMFYYRCSCGCNSFSKYVDKYGKEYFSCCRCKKTVTAGKKRDDRGIMI